MRRFLVVVLVLWLGVAVPSFAQTAVNMGTWNSQANAQAACVAAGVGPANSSPCALSVIGYKKYWEYVFPNAVYHWWYWAACGAGSIAEVVGGQCVPVCTYDTSIASTDPACAPPSCPAGQTYTAGACTPDLSSPGAGALAPESGVVVGTADAAGNVTWNSDGTLLRSGGGLVFNCDGWECTVSAADYYAAGEGGEGCTFPVGGGAVRCAFQPVYSGDPALAGVISVPSTGGGSYVALPTVGCPAGSVLDPANGLCVTGATSGTASTATTAGTAGTAGTGACPTGYVQSAEGICSGSADPSAFGGSGCPAGYTLVNGLCTGAAAISPGGVPGSTGNDVNVRDPGASPWSAQPGGMTEAEAGHKALITGVEESELPHGWTWSMESLGLPASGCESFNIGVGSHSFTLDPCPMAQKIRDLGAWVLYVFTMLGLFNIMTGKYDS